MPQTSPTRVTRRRSSLATLWCLMGVAGWLTATTTQAQDNERSLYVTVVVQGNGAPVSDLEPTDFVVVEDGAEREVLRVLPADTPMQVAVLVDTSASAQFATRDIRNALERLVARLGAAHDIALVTFGGPPRILVESTSRPDRLRDGIGQIFAFPDSAAYLLDALVDTAHGFERRESPRPVVVVITTEGLDYSRHNTNRVIEVLRAAGAAAHVVVLTNPATTTLRANQFGDPFNSALNVPDLYQRDLALTQVPEATGGQRRDVHLSGVVGDTVESLADLLTSQLEVVYSRPASLIPPDTIEVDIRREDLKAFGTPVRRTRENRP